jgi:NTE family protein
MPTESDRPGEIDHGPARLIPTDVQGERPQPGTGLCLSGGGYRAMLFHLGALIRLKELGVLGGIDRISSVSGGSIVAGLLGLRWSRLKPSDTKTDDLMEHVVGPIRNLAGRTIDAGAVIAGLALPGNAADRVESAYRSHLYGDATLQDFPDTPRFVINATNVQSMVLWRFSKPFMADYRVGLIKNPTIPIAKAVAASSAFPPVLSPLELDLDPKDFEPNSGLDLQQPPYTSQVVLTDGGVYDNLGVETVWKRYQTVFVSDGGGKSPAEPEPKRDWVRHAARILFIVDNQVRSMRLRQIIGAFANPNDEHKGAYWGIRTNIAEYGVADALPCPLQRTHELAEVATRLRRIEPELQERLINWGYAVCDAAMRKHDPKLRAPAAFPYPATPV